MTERLRLERLSVGPPIATRPKIDPDPAGASLAGLLMSRSGQTKKRLSKWARSVLQ